MIYLTQLIFVKEGKEEIFHQFEDFAIPLMEKYDGKILYRIRPQRDSIVTSVGEVPYEIHFMTFDSAEDLERFMKDDSRLDFLPLKEASVKATILVKGERM